MKLNFKTASLLLLSLFSSAIADSKSCLKAGRFGNYDGREFIEINVTKENICSLTAYELCKPMEIELLEISNVPKNNYMFDFGTTGLESDAVLYRETIINAVEGNVQFFQVDPQVKYKNKVIMIGFVKELCEKESPEDLDKIKVRIYGTLNSTDDPITEFQPEEAISLEDPKIKNVQHDCFENPLILPYIFSQKPNKRDFLYDDLLELRDEDIVGTDAYYRLNDLTEEFGKNMDITCRNWLYLFSLAKCYEAQQKLPEEFTFDELHPEVAKLLNSMLENNLSKRLTLCRRDMKPRQLDIEKEIEEKLKKKEQREEKYKNEL